MNLRFDNDAKFENFKSEVKKRLEQRTIDKIDIPDFRPSAVAILILNKNNEAHVFLTKRTDKVGTHKGEVSFPGGALDESDASIMHTALRETFEEAGIASEDIEMLGQFDDFFSYQRFHVSTFVGAIKYPYDYKTNPDEIEACLEAPLSIFYNKEYYRVDNMHMKGRDVSVYYYEYDGFTIWGLTARILTEFADKVLNG